ncbi:tetratricopeptide repeat protein [Candidatus Sumerlaeota bacterium]|nr:tetratricopeptide repeat protein [Candidatus Sumerlaeota bacterium]
MARPDSEPREDVARFIEGMKLMKAGRCDEAVEKFRYAASTGKDRPMEHYALAVALYKSRRLDAAREEFERFLSMNPQDNRYVQQAKAALAAIEQQEAKPAPGKAEANPLAASADYRDAVEAYLRGDYEVALAGFREALSEIPRNKHILNNLGLTLLAMRRESEAVEAFEKAIEIDPDFLEALNNLGLAWTQYGSSKAREAFEKALEADPEFFDALVNLGSLCYREGNLPEARRLWEKACALKPDDPQVRRNLEVFR